MPTTVNGEFNLTDLDGSNGFVIIDTGKTGSVSGAGDVNGDGFDDIIVGRADDTPTSYVIFGGSNSFGQEFNPQSLDGTNGFTVSGTYNAYFGVSVSSAGDVNGDGFDDVIIGVEGYSGEAYVVFGGDNLPSAFAISSLNGSNGFTLKGFTTSEYASYTAGSVSGAGDINGDGFDDVIIGAVGTRSPSTQTGKGSSYVVFGGASEFSSSIELSNLNGDNGFVVNAGHWNIGQSVSNAGDVNGDGFDDIIIGSSGYIIFGTSNSSNDTFNILTDLDNRTTGISLSSGNVADAGDINNDGYGDVIQGVSSRNNETGEIYVTFGDRTNTKIVRDYNELDGSNGFIVEGLQAGDNAGSSVASAGDVNGDGFDDIIIAANTADSNGISSAGQIYVIFGKENDFPEIFDLSTLDGSNGYIINGIDANDRSGTSVAGLGDINNDGYDDIIISAPGANNSSGESYVIFGGPSLPRIIFNSLSEATISENSTGIAFNLQASLGNDVNDNGLTYSFTGGSDQALFSIDSSTGELQFLAVPDYEMPTDSDEDNVYHLEVTATGSEGRSETQTLTITVTDVVDAILSVGTTSEDSLIGNSLNDTLDGGAGNDFLRGDDGDDFLIGGDGNDRLFAGPSDTGNDTVQGNDGDDVIGAGSGDDLVVGGDLGSTISNSNTGEAGNDTLFGGSGDDLLVGGSYNTSSSTAVNTGSGNNLIWAGSGDDTLFGDEASDLLGGGAGDDNIIAAGGDDVVYGGRGTDSNKDTIGGGAGNDEVFAGRDNDSVDGGSGDDTLFGGAGNDTVNGGNGDDLIYGGAGDDALSGGAGTDTFAFITGFGTDTISDFSTTDNDVLDLSEIAGLTVANIQTAATFSGGDTTLTLAGHGTLTLTGIDATEFQNMIDSNLMLVA